MSNDKSETTGQVQEDQMEIKKVKCKFCDFECEGNEEEIGMKMFWHNYQKHYPIFIGNELHRLGDNVLSSYLKA